MQINCKYCVEKSRTLMLTAYENTFYFALFNNFFSNGHRFNCSTCTGNMCNYSSTSGCHFSTWEINALFHILFTAKFKFFKQHLKVRSFERMFEFNQVHLGPSPVLYQLYLLSIDSLNMTKHKVTSNCLHSCCCHDNMNPTTSLQ